MRHTGAVTVVRPDDEAWCCWVMRGC